jgi:hypothetical protein
MTAPDPRPQILRKAADILTTRGRSFGEYFTPGEDPELSDCKVCVLGAIALAAGCDLTDMSLWDPQDANEDAVMDAARALAEHLHLLNDGWDNPNTVIQRVGGWHDGEIAGGMPSMEEVEAALLVTADALEHEAGEAR